MRQTSTSFFNSGFDILSWHLLRSPIVRSSNITCQTVHHIGFKSFLPIADIIHLNTDEIVNELLLPLIHFVSCSLTYAIVKHQLPSYRQNRDPNYYNNNNYQTMRFIEFGIARKESLFKIST